MMISKELLSEVLKDKIKRLIYSDFTYGIEDNYVLFAEDECVMFEINIYELGHICKEWARDNEFFLRSFYDYEGAFCYISAPEWVDKIEIPKTGFCSNSEPEAVFRACEYILEQKELK